MGEEPRRVTLADCGCCRLRSDPSLLANGDGVTSSRSNHRNSLVNNEENEAATNYRNWKMTKEKRRSNVNEKKTNATRFSSGLISSQLDYVGFIWWMTRQKKREKNCSQFFIPFFLKRKMEIIFRSKKKTSTLLLPLLFCFAFLSGFVVNWIGLD